MADRAKVAPIGNEALLEPVAAPVDTFVRAAPAERSSLYSLAEGLSGLDSGLRDYVEARNRKQAVEDAAKGEAAFYQNNAEGYAEAVQKGHIPAYSSPGFMRAYKRAQGEAAGYALEQKFQLAYDQWDGKSNPDPAAFTGFMEGFLKENLAGDIDPAVYIGLRPHLAAIQQSGTVRHIQDAHDAVYKGSIDAHAATVDQTIDSANTQGLANEKGVDYDGAFQKVLTIRDAAIKSGASPDDFDPKMLDAIAAKAIEHQDGSYLKFFDQKVPGHDYTWGQTPYGQKLKQETEDRLDVIARSGAAEDRQRQKDEDRKAKDDITGQAIDFIVKNPTAPVPDDLLATGKKYDPEFQVHLNEWRKNIQEGRSNSDPQAVLQLHDAILNGGGMDVIRKAMANGTIRSASDLDTAYSLFKSVEAGGDKAAVILKSNSAEMVLSTIRQRTAGPNDNTNPFAPPSYTDAGLAASFDFKRQVLDWSAQHPNATAQEQEAAIAIIGRGILAGIQQTQGPLQTPSSASQNDPSNPYHDSFGPLGVDPRQAAPAPAIAAPAPAPAAPTVTAPQPAPTPVAPAPPAAPVAPAATPPNPVQPQPDLKPITPEAADWFNKSLTPAQRQAITNLAKAAGITPEQQTQKLFEGFQKSQPPSPIAPDRRSEVGDFGGAVRPVSYEEVGQAFSDAAPTATPEDFARSMGTMAVQEITGALEDAITNRTTSAPEGTFTLSTLKGEPQASRILDFVSTHESRGNYNAYYRHADSTHDLSVYTIDQILAEQRRMIRGGAASTAIGRYQFLRKTLASLRTEMGLSGSERFTPELQDRLAFALLKRRGYDAWKAGKLSTPAFARRLSMEWASLPDPRTGRSYYAGDGLNHSLTSAQNFLAALGNPTA